MLFDAAYGNSGQWCIAVKRLHVYESIHRQFVDEFVAHARGKKVGNGLDPGHRRGRAPGERRP